MKHPALHILAVLPLILLIAFLLCVFLLLMALFAPVAFLFYVARSALRD